MNLQAPLARRDLSLVCTLFLCGFQFCTPARTQSSTTPNHLVRNSPVALTAGQFGDFGKELQDFDGDGFADYAIAAPTYPHLKFVGRVYVVSGRTGSFLQSFDGEQAHSDFGRGAIADIGDVNKDGQRDLAIGAGKFDGTGKNTSGKVYVFDGKTGKVIWSRVGAAIGDMSGYQIEALGPTKSSTPPVLAVAEPGYDAPTKLNCGRIVFLNAATGTPLGEARGKNAFRNLGMVTTSYPEASALYVSDAIGDVWTAAATGSVALLQAAPATARLRASLSIVRTATGALLPVVGRRLASSNSLVGNGSVEVLSGGSAVLRVVGTKRAHGVGSHVASTRDIDGDGVEEIAFLRAYDSLNSETIVVKLDGTPVRGTRYEGSGVKAVGSIPDVTGDRRGELMLWIASGLSQSFEARLLAQGMSIDKVKNDPSGFVADYRIDMPTAVAAQRPFVQLYSLSRTSPGTILPLPSRLVPLNFDAITDAALLLANTPVFPNAIGILSTTGDAKTRAVIPASISAALKGRYLASVTAVFGTSSILVTNPVESKL